MKYSSFLSASALATLASSSAVVLREPDPRLAPVDPASWKRASPQAPDGYAPAKVDCPSTRPAIRSADRLSDSETAWLKKRRPNTIDPMKDFLKRANINGFDAAAYIDKHKDNTTALPNIAPQRVKRIRYPRNLGRQ
jgi:lysophospholipase